MGDSLYQFIAILNPFALCLYLIGVMEDLDAGEFLRVFLLSCGIALVVFSVFALAGEALLLRVLGVHPAALRIFGGIIFFVIAYGYVTRGYRAAEMLRGPIDELPSAIALPYMIGAGTVTQAILVGKRHSGPAAVGLIAAAIVFTALFVLAFNLIRHRITATNKPVFDRYINILARINGLLIGTISTEMIVNGLSVLWHSR